VSPVIGVILMVAITVILAAVIAVFVFGMTDEVQTTKVVSMTGSVINNEISATVQGGTGVGDIRELLFKVNGTKVTNGKIFLNGVAAPAPAGGNAGDNPYVGTVAVGDIFSIDGVSSGDLLVVATFSDGSEQIVFQRKFS
jgi:flagellin-like protein